MFRKSLSLVSYLLLRAVLLPFQLPPLRVSRAMGRGLGAVWFVLDWPHRGLVLRNLRLAYGAEKSERELRALRRAVFRSLGVMVSDFAWGQRLDADSAAARLQVEGLEHHKAAHARSNRVILASAHQASFEWGAWAGLITGVPMIGIQRQIKNPWLATYMTHRRGRMGVTVWHPEGAVARFGTWTGVADLGLMMDQRGRKNAVTVQFFGQPVRTMPGAAVLALRHGIPIVTAWMSRTPEGMRIRFGPALPLPEGGDTPENVQALTQAITDRVEASIRERPEEWFWVHDRWKA